MLSYRAVQCSAVLCSAVQCRAVQCSAAPLSVKVLTRAVTVARSGQLARMSSTQSRPAVSLTCQRLHRMALGPGHAIGVSPLALWPVCSDLIVLSVSFTLPTRLLALGVGEQQLVTLVRDQTLCCCPPAAGAAYLVVGVRCVELPCVGSDRCPCLLRANRLSSPLIQSVMVERRRGVCASAIALAAAAVHTQARASARADSSAITSTRTHHHVCAAA